MLTPMMILRNVPSLIFASGGKRTKIIQLAVNPDFVRGLEKGNGKKSRALRAKRRGNRKIKRAERKVSDPFRPKEVRMGRAETTDCIVHQLCGGNKNNASRQ